MMFFLPNFDYFVIVYIKMVIDFKNFLLARTFYLLFLLDHMVQGMYDLTHTNTSICVCERRGWGYAQKTV